MSEPRDYAVVGFRNEPGRLNIGGELVRQIQQPGVAERLNLHPLPRWVMKTSGFMCPDGVTPLGYDPFTSTDEKWPAVTFVCLPSNVGELETHVLLTALERDKNNIAITAAKEALANPDSFARLRDASDNFRRLGKTAALGGGTHLADVARQWCRDVRNLKQIHLIANGTINAITSDVARGMSLGQAAEQAVALHYAEPGKDGEPVNPYEVLQDEARLDLPKKIALFHNDLGLSPVLLDYRNIAVDLSVRDISAAMREAPDRRYIISLYPPNYVAEHDEYPEDDIVGRWTYNHHEYWRIVGGYQSTRSSPLNRFAGISGPDNGVIVGVGPAETDGIYGGPLGPGAGLRPTVNAMLDEQCLLAGTAQ